MRFEQLYPKRTPEDLNKQKEAREPLDAEFSEKWKHPKRVETPLGETIDLYDMSQENAKTPIPVMLWGGFSGVAEHSKKNMREFYALGRHSMVVGGSHGVDYEKKDIHLDKRALDPEYRKVAANMAALNSVGVQKIDAFAHSKGCIDLLLAVAAYPDRFRNLVLVEPGGMNPNESLLQVIMRNQLGDLPSFKAEIKGIESGDPEYQWDVHPDDADIKDGELSGKEIQGHPIRSMREVYSIAHVKVIDLLRDLKQKGIGIAIVQGVDDKMFPIETLTGAVAKDANGDVMFNEAGKPIMEKRGTIADQKISPEEDITKIVDGFYSVKGIHTRFYHQPKEYTQLVDGILTALAAKRGEV